MAVRKVELTEAKIEAIAERAAKVELEKVYGLKHGQVKNTCRHSFNRRPIG